MEPWDSVVEKAIAEIRRVVGYQIDKTAGPIGFDSNGTKQYRAIPDPTSHKNKAINAMMATLELLEVELDSVRWRAHQEY